jgi:hypothetical protein
MSDLSRHMVVEEIKTNGYLAVDFLMSGSDIDPLFKDFGVLTDEVYSNTESESSIDIVESLKNVATSRVGDSAGFLARREVGKLNPFEPARKSVGTENKDILHFTPRTESFAREYLSHRGGMPAIMRRVIDSCTDIQQSASQALVPALRELGLSDIMLGQKASDNLNNVHVLRVLRYPAKTETEQSAKSWASPFADLHFDRAKMTAAIWESLPGLVGLPFNNNKGNPSLTVDQLDEAAKKAIVSPIDHRTNELKLFAGAGYNCLPQSYQEVSGNLDPLLHGVVDVSGGQERYAVVLFINQLLGFRQASVPKEKECDFQTLRGELVKRDARKLALPDNKSWMFN